MASINIEKGNILIAKPFLGDSNFERTSILLCEHNEEGTFGFVLNQKLNASLDEITQGKFKTPTDVYLGGPVQQNTLHFIHRLGNKIDSSVEVVEGLYWGGNYEQVQTMLNLGTIQESDIRFFIGYSGWGREQLAGEVQQDSWIVTKSTANFIFETDPNQFWREILKNMGGKFKQFANYPIDPRLN